MSSRTRVVGRAFSTLPANYSISRYCYETVDENYIYPAAYKYMRRLANQQNGYTYKMQYFCVNSNEKKKNEK